MEAIDYLGKNIKKIAKEYCASGSIKNSGSFQAHFENQVKSIFTYHLLLDTQENNDDLQKGVIRMKAVRPFYLIPAYDYNFDNHVFAEIYCENGEFKKIHFITPNLLEIDAQATVRVIERGKINSCEDLELSEPKYIKWLTHQNPKPKYVYKSGSAGEPSVLEFSDLFVIDKTGWGTTKKQGKYVTNIFSFTEVSGKGSLTLSNPVAVDFGMLIESSMSDKSHDLDNFCIDTKANRIWIIKPFLRSGENLKITYYSFPE